MREKVLLVIVGSLLCGLVAGCGGGSTARDVAKSYGLLNNWDLQPGIADVVQSGQADQMIAAGQAKVRNRVNGLGSGRVLVTEYLIRGEVYRVEVRKPINPLKNVPQSRIRHANTKQGFDENVISWLKLDCVCATLRGASYQAKPEVAYRAWRGTDGVEHSVKTRPGQVPDWPASPEPLDLNIRTKGWPVPGIWIQGLAGSEQDAQAATDPFSGKQRWYIMNPGPAGFTGNELIPFINLKLYSKIGS